LIVLSSFIMLNILVQTPLEFKLAHRAVYNLTVRDIILPFKNLTGGRQGKGILGTLASFRKEARAWTFTVGGN